MKLVMAYALSSSLTGVLFAQSVWPAPRHDNQATGLAPVAGPRIAALDRSEVILTGEGVNFSPGPLVVDGYTVYIASGGSGGSSPNYRVHAVDSRSGATLWVRPGIRPNIAADGKVIVTAVQTNLDPMLPGQVIAYNPDGSTAWTWQTPINSAGTFGATIAPDGSIYGSYYSQPQQGSIYTGVMRFKLDANGRLQWHVGGGVSEYQGGPLSSPLILSNGDLIWNGTHQGNSCPGIRRISASSGAVQWALTCNADSSIILSGDIIASMEPFGASWAITGRHAGDGHVLWRGPTLPTLSGSPGPLALLPNGEIVCVYGRIYRFSPVNGSIVVSFPAPSSVPGGLAGGSPVVSADGIVYFWRGGEFRYSGRLYAMDGMSGATLFEYPNNDFSCRGATQPVLMPDGSLFLAWLNKAVCNDFSGVVQHVTISGPGCVADFNRDGLTDFFDYLDFVAAFGSNLPVADINGDRVVDLFDYLDFVEVFSTGC